MVVVSQALQHCCYAEEERSALQDRGRYPVSGCLRIPEHHD